MLHAINTRIEVIARASAYLLHLDSPSTIYPPRSAKNISIADLVLTLDENYSQVGLSTKRVLKATSQLLLFNSLGSKRSEVVCVLVPATDNSQQAIEVQAIEESDGDGSWSRVKEQQLQPVVEVDGSALSIASDKQKVCLCEF